MAKIVYKTVVSNTNLEYDIEYLNEIGKEGWILSRVKCEFEEKYKYNGLDDEYYNICSPSTFTHLFYKVIE